MSSPSLIVVSGPSGSGKTTWISQSLNDQSRPLFYLCPGLGNQAVDLARVGYCFPWVYLIPEDQAQQVLAELPNNALVYLELGFNLDLSSPFLASLPCRKVAVLPPDLTESKWHDWADEVIPGNDLTVSTSDKLPELWRSPLTGQVFDPASLDEILFELTSDAYGQVHRAKGIFELPDGRAFYVDFVDGLYGTEYTELNISRWLDGRPDRLSGLEIVGYNLERDTISQTLVDACLTDEVLANYQEQYKAMSEQENETEQQDIKEVISA